MTKEPLLFGQVARKMQILPIQKNPSLPKIFIRNTTNHKYGPIYRMDSDQKCEFTCKILNLEKRATISWSRGCIRNQLYISQGMGKVCVRLYLPNPNFCWLKKEPLLGSQKIANHTQIKILDQPKEIHELNQKSYDHKFRTIDQMDSQYNFKLICRTLKL